MILEIPIIINVCIGILGIIMLWVMAKQIIKDIREGKFK
jgi:hypothetical protein